MEWGFLPQQGMLQSESWQKKSSNTAIISRHWSRSAPQNLLSQKIAPSASRLIKRGLPIIDERIKEIIAEIQEKAKALCKQVKDTEYKEIGQQANEIGQKLSKIRDPIGLEKGIRNQNRCMGIFP